MTLINFDDYKFDYNINFDQFPVIFKSKKLVVGAFY